MTYATRLFRTATQMQPYAYQGWLEWAKLCEESGDVNQAKSILKEGLSFCPDNENLLVKCIKVMERDQEYTEIRKLIKSEHWRI
jgi:predicted negative regulator of RcsB-dependent stress response